MDLTYAPFTPFMIGPTKTLPGISPMELAAWLLERGVALDAVDSDGRTALQVAEHERGRVVRAHGEGVAVRRERDRAHAVARFRDPAHAVVGTALELMRDRPARDVVDGHLARG